MGSGRTERSRFTTVGTTAGMEKSAIDDGIRVTIHTLGRFALAVGSTALEAPSTQKARALMVFLAMHIGCDVARERLMEAFWPTADPQRGRDSLNMALHAIRRCFRGAGLAPDAFLVATRSVVRWIADTELDAERVIALGDSPSPAALRAAIDAYRGDFLAGCYDEWCVEQRERLAAAYERALVCAVRDLDDLEAARKLIDLDPYEESAYALLLESETAAGRTGAAASLAVRCRSALTESGGRPSEELLRRLRVMAAETRDSSDLAFAGRDRENAAVERVLDAVDDLLALGILSEDASAHEFIFRHDVYAYVAKALAAPGFSDVRIPARRAANF
jgi:DNA-binding SARP family transcriptional activator